MNIQIFLDKYIYLQRQVKNNPKCFKVRVSKNTEWKIHPKTTMYEPLGGLKL